MDINIKEKIEELVQKIRADKTILTRFQQDPVSTVEKLIGIDLPNDQLEKLVNGIKAKITADKVGDVLEGLGGLFKRD